MRNKIFMVTALFVVMVSMIGIAAADPVTPTLMKAAPNQDQVAPQPLTIGPDAGDTVTLSMELKAMLNDADTFSMTCTILPVNALAVANPGGITVTTCASPLDPPLDQDPTTFPDVIVVTNTGAPTGALYSLVVDVAGVTNTFDIGTEQRFINIPEFPAVALPVGAVIGLVFLFQSRKRKEK